MKNNYSVIIYLDKKLNQKVKEVQRKLSDLTGSRACLDLWEPHLTIGAGVRVDDKELNSLYKDIRDNLERIEPFKIKIKDCSFMDNWMEGKLEGFTKYVACFDVINNEKLQHLFDILKKNVTDIREIFYWPISEYNPHITMAFKDLEREGFLKAKEFLKDKKFENELVVNHIALAKENPDESWAEFKRFNFEDKKTK